MAEKALRMKKEFLGQVFYWVHGNLIHQRKLMVCLGDMFNYKQSVREKNSLLFVYLTAEEDKRLRLPEKRCVFHLKKLILFFVKNE